MAEPYRGERRSTTVRYPVEIHADLLAAADAAGLELSSYLVGLAAMAHGHAVPDWCRPETDEGRPVWAPMRGGDSFCPQAG